MAKIKVIKKNQTAPALMPESKTAQILKTETRRGAREVVQSWIDEYRQAQKAKLNAAMAFRQSI